MTTENAYMAAGKALLGTFVKSVDDSMVIIYKKFVAQLWNNSYYNYSIKQPKQ